MTSKVLVFATSEIRAQQIDHYRKELATENLTTDVTVIGIESLGDSVLGKLESADEAFCVVAFEPDELEVILELPLARMGKGAILVSDTDNTSILRRSRDAGALDYLPVSLLETDFMAIIRRTAQQRGATSLAIGFTGAGGGAGASTIAAIFAEYCARELQRRVALADFDVTFGRQGVDFGVATKTSFATHYNKNMASDRLLEGFYKSVEVNLDLYANPHSVDLAEVDALADGSSFLKNLRHNYDVIVLDIPTRLANFEPELLTHLDMLNVVFLDDLQGIRNLSNTLKWLEDTKMAPFHVVLNKRTPKSKLTIKELKDLLKLEQMTVIEPLSGVQENQARIDLKKPVSLKVASPLRSALDGLTSANGLSKFDDKNKANGITGLFKKVISRST